MIVPNVADIGNRKNHKKIFKNSLQKAKGGREWGKAGEGKALPLRSFLRGFYGHDLSREYASSPDAEKTRESRGKRLVEKILACGQGSDGGPQRGMFNT